MDCHFSSFFIAVSHCPPPYLVEDARGFHFCYSAFFAAGCSAQQPGENAAYGVRGAVFVQGGFPSVLLAHRLTHPMWPMWPFHALALTPQQKSSPPCIPASCCCCSWMSWEIFRCNLNTSTDDCTDKASTRCISEALYQGITDGLVSSGLAAVGYSSVHMDDCVSHFYLRPSLFRTSSCFCVQSSTLLPYTRLLATPL